MKTYFSNRIYKNTLDNTHVAFIDHALLVFNRAKQYAYATAIKEKRSGSSRRLQSMHLTVKNRFSLNDYYTNSAVREAKALISSQEELKKLYISEKQAKITSIKKKIAKAKSKMTTLQKIKKSIIAGKVTFNKKSNYQQCGNFFVVKFKNKTDLYYNLYDFEHLFLDKEIAFQKAQIGRFSFRLDRLQKQIDSLKNNMKSIVFGSKKLFKSQFTLEKYQENHRLWKRDFERARFNQLTISGRKDAKDGNFVFHYNPPNYGLTFETPTGIVSVDEVLFPYGQNEVDAAILNQVNNKTKKLNGNPIAWSIEDHGKYYIFKISFNEVSSPYVNFAKTAGVIGVDCNFNHFAIAETNESGQLLRSFVQKFDLKNKTSNQITKIIEAEAIHIVNKAIQVNKPIVVEKLDTTISKGSNLYGNKKANLHMSMFAYKKMLDSLKSRAAKFNIEVFEVNPAYTSQIGKIKYMKPLGISIHQAAAFVIARRAMGYKETLPPVLYSLLPEKIVGLHDWVHWKHVTTILKGIRTNAFYQSELFNLAKFRIKHELFAPGALTKQEQMGLAKILK